MLVENPSEPNRLCVPLYGISRSIGVRQQLQSGNNTLTPSREQYVGGQRVRDLEGKVKGQRDFGGKVKG